MKLKDSYIHGLDDKGVVKSLYFATSAETVWKADFSLTYNTASAKDLVFLLADIAGTKVGIPIPTFNQNTTGYAAKILTKSRATNASHYLVFVDSNNSTATEESLYTDSQIIYNPSTDTLSLSKVTVNTTSGFNFVGIENGSSNVDRNVWFSHSNLPGTPVKNDNFKFNPGNGGKLFVNNIQGTNIKITIGNKNVVLGGTYTPDTTITSTSTHNTIPSSLAVYNAIINGIATNDAMIFKGILNGGLTAANTTYTPLADRGHTYKVGNAGYINGEYYLTNDTFICTEDNTAAATSSNVNTIKTKWAVVEGNGDYLSIHGGKMYGPLQWNDSTALPLDNNPLYFLTIDSFANGGATKWASRVDVLNSLKTGLYWADQTLATVSSNDTTPRFGKVGIGGEVDGTALLKVYGNTIVMGLSYFGGTAEFNNTVNFDDDTNYLGTARFNNDVKIGIGEVGVRNLEHAGTYTHYGLLEQYGNISMNSNNIVGVGELRGSGHIFMGNAGFTQLEVTGDSLITGRLTVRSTIDGGEGSLKIGDITASGTVRTNGSLITHAIKPLEDNTYYIGNSSKYYKAVFAHNLLGNALTATTWETPRTFTIGAVSKTVDGSANVSWSLSELSSGLYWADLVISPSSSTITEPLFAKVGIAGAKDNVAKLKVYGNEIITGNLTIGGCTLVYDSSTPCLKFTF